jgi:hypothetical protein
MTGFGQFDLISITVTRHNAENAAEKPGIRLMVELDKRKYKRAIKIVTPRPILLPLLPFFLVSCENLQWMNDFIPPSKMDLVLGKVL